MKVFFDTNVYIAEALLGAAAEQMRNATFAAKWRVSSLINFSVTRESSRNAAMPPSLLLASCGGLFAARLYEKNRTGPK